jgi:hypothetical protein
MALLGAIKLPRTSCSLSVGVVPCCVLLQFRLPVSTHCCSRCCAPQRNASSRIFLVLPILGVLGDTHNQMDTRLPKSPLRLNPKLFLHHPETHSSPEGTSSMNRHFQFGVNARRLPRKAMLPFQNLLNPPLENIPPAWW